MKKVKIIGKLINKIEDDVCVEQYCPLGNSNWKHCSKDCAWFDIADSCSTVVTENGTITRVDVKTITCKGIPIAELIEE